MKTTTLLTQNTKFGISWKHFAITVSLLVIGAILDYYIYLLAGAMTGAGHGIYIPILLLCGPVGVFMWPFLIAGANSFIPSVRLFAKVITGIFYLWLLFHFREFSYFSSEYHRTERAESLGTFWTWAALIMLMHGLIWLPVPLIKHLKKALQSKTAP